MSDDEWAAAAAGALAPYAWRALTGQMVARMVVGAVDRHSVLRFVSSIPGAHVGALPPAEPADPGDERVHVLLRALAGRRWRAEPLPRLCTDLIRALASWRTERELLGPDLRRLPEGH